MSLGEFDLIRRYFRNRSVRRSDSALSIGDDCALVRTTPGMETAITVDTLVEGVHFLPDVDPERLGHKALAVNLSDLAAMGAEPAWATLALTLPTVDEPWLDAFGRGFFGLAQRFGLELIGGDTTRGPLSITIQAMGLVPEGASLRRSGARPGDEIYVSGPLGGAGLGLKMRLGEVDPSDNEALEALERPSPRVELGRALRGLATACIDISDGLAADLGHLLSASSVGATLDYHALPLIDAVRGYLDHTRDWQLPLEAGDDYELCFTVPADRSRELLLRAERIPLTATRIGHIESRPGLRIRRDQNLSTVATKGYEHFPNPDRHAHQE